MPRTRPEDFWELDSGFLKQPHPWARWWRHRDGTVSHVHYDGRDGRVIIAVRHDDAENTPFGSESVR